MKLNKKSASQDITHLVSVMFKENYCNLAPEFRRTK